MSKIKLYTKYAVLFLMSALLLSAMACGTSAGAEETVLNSYTVEMGENAYILIEETATTRTAEYYVDGKLAQRSVYDFESGEIISNNISEGTEENYHIDDFLVTEKVLDKHTVELGENAYIEIEETASKKTARYFEGEELLYRAVRSAETGEISYYCYSLSEKMKANEIRERMDELLMTEE